MPKFFTMLICLVLLFSLQFPYVEASEVPFSTNDLSILFPLNNLGKPVPTVKPANPQWKIISRDNFDAVLSGAKNSDIKLTDKLKDPESWYLVGFRYSPCSFFVQAVLPCKEQLRFIFQSFRAENGSGLEDYALHVVYNLRQSRNVELTNVLKSFRAMKNKYWSYTLDKPLSVNPILSSSRAKEYIEDLKQLIIQPFINKRKPSIITMMGFGSGGSGADNWTFFTGTINSEGVWQQSVLNMGAPLLKEDITLDEHALELNTSVKLEDNRFNLFYKMENRFLAATKILDPKQANDNNTNCASCHQADRSVFIGAVGSDVEGKKPVSKYLQAFLSRRMRVSELLIEPKIHEARMGLEISSFRMFGYRDDKPVLSQRTVNDAAAATEYANSIFGIFPRPQCANDGARARLVKCFLQGTNAKTLRQCLVNAKCLAKSG